MKHPLSRALRAANLSVVDVASHLSVDPKTVNRWLAGRLPYPRHRAALATLTSLDERVLWPGIDALQTASPNTSDVIAIYPQRSSVPMEVWRHLFERAEHEICILAYSCLFLAEDAGTQAILRAKARAGIRIRIALGDPNGTQIAQRGSDEGVDWLMSARIANALHLLEPLIGESGSEVRLHDTALYNSIYRADNELMANTHVYGCTASGAPVLHLRQTEPMSMATTYFDSFERVWANARQQQSTHSSASALRNQRISRRTTARRPSN